MAYTEQDRDSVRSAIIALATGTRKTSVTFSSQAGSRTIQYGATDLKSLRELLALIEGELGQTNQTSRTILTRTRKGL